MGNKFALWQVAFLMFVLGAGASAQDVEPLALKPLFADDFQKDSRADYNINGDVSWKPGRLSFSDGGFAGRMIEAGSWVEVQVGLEFADLAKDGDQSLTNVGFDLEGPNDCVVAWIRTRQEGKTVGRVRIFDARLQEGKMNYVLVREQIAESDIAHGTWTVGYRNGLVRVESPTGDTLLGHIRDVAVERGTAPATNVWVGQFAGSSDLLKFAASGVALPRWLTDEEREQLASARERFSDVLRLYQQGEYSMALGLAQEDLDIHKRILGEDHAANALRLNFVGNLYTSIGDFKKAMPLYVEATVIQRKALGEEHPDYAMSLNNLAGLYESMADYAKAMPLYLQSLDIRKKVQGENNPDYVVSLNNIAYLYHSLGDYAKAEPLYLRARETRKRFLGENHPDYAVSLNNLAELYRSLGEPTKAEPLYLQALGIRKKVLGENHLDYAVSLGSLAEFYRSLGDPTKAEPLYIQALDIQKKVLGEEHPDYAVSLNNLALLYYQLMDDYAKAEQLYLLTLRIQKKVLGEDHPYFAVSLNNLAELYRSLGDPTKAEPLYIQALDIQKKVLGEEHPDYAFTLNNLAELYRSLGDYAKAEPFCVQARDIRKKVLGENHPDYAISLNNLALLYQSMGDPTKAEALFAQALDTQKRVVGENHLDYATSLHNLAWLHWSMGDYALAEKLTVQCLNVKHKVAGELLAVSSEAQALNYLATQWSTRSLLISLGFKLDQPCTQQYEILWRGRRLLHRTTSQRQRLLHELQKGRPDTKDDHKKLVSTRRRVGQLILAPAASDAEKAKQRRDELSKLNDEKETLEKKLARALPAFSRTLAVEHSQPADLLGHLPQAVVFVDLFRYLRFEQDQDRPGIKGESYTPSYVAFILSRDRSISRVDIGSAEVIEASVKEWREAIAQEVATKEVTEKLSQLLWTPIAKQLPDNTSIIYLCPDAALATMPWAALPTGKEDRVLLEDYAIAVVPHGQFLFEQLRENSTERTANGDLLLVGNVSYDNRPPESRKSDKTLLATNLRSAAVGKERLEWPALDGTKTEIANVARFANERHVESLSGTNASTDEILTALPQAEYAHIATHGFFADSKFRSYLQVNEEHFTKQGALSLLGNRSTVAGRNPLVLSGLVFAGANLPRETDEYGLPKGDGGILTAEAIAGLDLRNLDLAVLSACETGLGDVAGGEGVYGLQRAFHIGGAKAVVASLWKVDDEATQQLMSLFYENLWEKGLPAAEALRQAQLTILRSGSASGSDRGIGGTRTKPSESVGQRTHPKYWAGWVLSGYSGDISAKPSLVSKTVDSETPTNKTSSEPDSSEPASESDNTLLFVIVSLGAVALVVGLLAYWRRHRTA